MGGREDEQTSLIRSSLNSFLIPLLNHIYRWLVCSMLSWWPVYELRGLTLSWLPSQNLEPLTTFPRPFLSTTFLRIWQCILRLLAFYAGPTLWGRVCTTLIGKEGQEEMKPNKNETKVAMADSELFTRAQAFLFQKEGKEEKTNKQPNKSKGPL